MKNRLLDMIRIALALIFTYSLPLTSCFAALTLDNTFAGGGRLTVSFPDSTTNYSSSGLRIFPQSTGRIVAVGYFTNMTADGQLPGIAVFGLTSAGAVDSTYSLVADWQSNGFTSLGDAVMYPDGRVLRLSRFFNVVGSSTVRAARTEVNGPDDGVFGSNVNIGTGAGGFGTDKASQIAIRSDGKIVVLIVFNSEYTLYRLNADGTRDTSFGANGIVRITFNKIAFPPESALEMIALPDGKLLLAGHVPPFSNGSSNLFLARLTETGNWDKTFGRSGFLQIPFGPGLTGRVQRALLQPDGNILLCGSIANSDTDTWMMRFRSNGRTDTSFGSLGVVITDFEPAGMDAAASMVLSSDGKIRIAGSHGTPSRFFVARYSAAGALEESTSFPFTAGQNSSASDIALQPDGKVVVIGGTRNPNAAINGDVMAIARLTE
jgi:uncharacterized delta-60 repeat protein